MSKQFQKLAKLVGHSMARRWMKVLARGRARRLKAKHPFPRRYKSEADASAGRP